MSGNNPWDRKVVQTAANSGSNVNLQFTNRPMHGAEHQHYRGNVNRNVGGGDLIVSTSPMAISSESGGVSTQANMPSKTGVEIWGTPDPMPFSGANEQAASNKCVARVS